MAGRFIAGRWQFRTRDTTFLFRFTCGTCMGTLAARITRRENVNEKSAFAARKPQRETDEKDRAHNSAGRSSRSGIVPGTRRQLFLQRRGVHRYVDAKSAR